ncbi:MAG: hypothetical protein QXT65_08190 [Candidatus Nitrosocaldaceae archaeon]
MDKIQVSISKELYEKIKRRILSKDSKFNSIEEYIEYLLLYAVDNIQKEQELVQKLTNEEEEEIKERLKRLGYI